MHSLKCEHCGYLNEIKSEYLVFCAGCLAALAILVALLMLADDIFSGLRKIFHF